MDTRGPAAPHGYTIDPTDHVLHRHPDEAPIVEEIFGLYTYQRLGTRAIAAQLNRRGLTSDREGPHRTVPGEAGRRLLGADIRVRPGTSRCVVWHNGHAEGCASIPGREILQQVIKRGDRG